MSNIATIAYGSVKEYATVPARLKEFRSTNPRASITTEPKFLDNGSVVIQATIVADLADEASARSTGTAMYSEQEMRNKKAFEKLETIATGRALSLLGYLNNGEVASSEEVLEFEQYREDKVAEAIKAIKTAKDRKELADIQSSLPAPDQKQLNDAIRSRLKELSDGKQ